MAKKLVIVESPAKAKTIEKFLGRDFTVLASRGHIIDLPKKGLGVNTRKDFAPHYEIIEKKDGLIDELKAASKRADEVYLAPDPDREGEIIAFVPEEYWSITATLSKLRQQERFEAVLIARLKDFSSLNGDESVGDEGEGAAEAQNGSNGAKATRTSNSNSKGRIKISSK